MEDLPSKDELTKRIHDLQARMAELRKAPLVEKYTGPVLFEGQAAAELLAQGFGSAILGSPRVVVDDVRFEGIFGANRGTLSDKVGGRVLPEFLSLKDDPTAGEFGGKPLLGGYQVDEDGVKARPTAVVENGVLKTLLHTRGLIVGTTTSTASKRGSGPAPANLVLTSEKTMPADQLKAELIRLVKQRGKEYGVLVRRMANPMMAPTLGRSRTVIITNGADGLNLEPLTIAYKVYPDGREELARNLRIQGMQLASFKEILAVSDQPAVYTAPFQARLSAPIMGTFYSPGLPTLVSVVTPSLLFDELTLQRPSGEVPNLPFTRHPYFEGK
jgi:TldD protein